MEGRGKVGKGVVALGLLPKGVALGLGLGQLPHQGGIQAGLSLPLLAQKLQVALLLLTGMGSCFGLSVGQQVGVLR